MPIELTSEQRSDLARQGSEPAVVIDPVTNRVYYLVAGDVFDRLKSLLGGDVNESYSEQSAVAGAAGWDDPEMDAYDDYDAHRRRS
jgi:hypothetical protein